jgi:protein required for attachment to host cells
MPLPHGTIVAVVDGDKLELFRNIGNTTAAAELSRMDAPKLDEHVPALVMLRVRPTPGIYWGRMRTPQQWSLSSIRGPTKGEIRHLVVVAPPRTLGEMRRHYDKQLEAIYVGEAHKDLVGRSGADVL